MARGFGFWEWHRHFWNWRNWAEAEEHLGLGNGIGDIRSWATEQLQRVRKWKKKRFRVLESLDLSLKSLKSSTRKSLTLSSKPASRKMDSPSDTFPGSFYSLTLTLISVFFASSPSVFILLHFFPGILSIAFWTYTLLVLYNKFFPLFFSFLFCSSIIWYLLNAISNARVVWWGSEYHLFRWCQVCLRRLPSYPLRDWCWGTYLPLHNLQRNSLFNSLHFFYETLL